MRIEYGIRVLEIDLERLSRMFAIMEVMRMYELQEYFDRWIDGEDVFRVDKDTFTIFLLLYGMSSSDTKYTKKIK